jgi:hypothetical protein
MSDLITVIEGLDLVVSMATGHVHPDDLLAAEENARRARLRYGHIGSTLVFALIGGTGSGKSSVLNALAGEAVASVSEVRPHTSRPLAWVPEDAEPALSEMLDRLGIEDRMAQDRFPRLALLDMTDVDSVELPHRALVESLLPEVDGVLWVLDPEKYHDPVLHNEFIAPLADSADQFVFVLNQIDRLEPDELPAVVEDLRVTLEGEGITAPVVFAVAADPPGGDPIGIYTLAEHLRHRLDVKTVHFGRVLADTRRAARSLATAAHLHRGGSLDFEERWRRLLDGIVGAISIYGPGAGTIEEVACGVEDFIGRLAAESGGPFGVRLRHSFTSDRIDAVVRAAADRARRSFPPVQQRHRPGVWSDLLDEEKRSATGRIFEEELQRRIGGPLREIIWERAALAASVAGLAVDASSAEHALRRRLSVPSSKVEEGVG